MAATNTYEPVSIETVKPSPRNARTHSQAQVKQIAASIEEFGFTNPVLIDEAQTILAGHGRLEAAKYLGLKQVPVLRIEHMPLLIINSHSMQDGMRQSSQRSLVDLLNLTSIPLLLGLIWEMWTA